MTDLTYSEYFHATASTEQLVSRDYTSRLPRARTAARLTGASSRGHTLTQVTRLRYERVVHRALHRLGFARVWRSHDTAEPGQKWSDNIEHSTWRRQPSAQRVQDGTSGGTSPTLDNAGPGVETNELCRLERERRNYTNDHLNCFAAETKLVEAIGARS